VTAAARPNLRPARRVETAMRRALPAALGALGLALALVPGSAGAASPVRILVEEPDHGEVVRNKVHQAPIRGNAVAEGERPAAFDVMIVIDVSGSTKAASGTDVDGDGEIGLNPHFELLPPGSHPEGTASTDPDDTILAAEVAAARALVESVELGRVRIGLVSFSGEMNPVTGERAEYDQQDAWVEVPLTEDAAALRRALGAIRARGPHGGTNFAAGVRLGIRELSGLSGTTSRPRPDAKKVMLFLTDGLPTFPIGSGSDSEPGDVEAALTAARLAHKAGITINSYALGPSALTNPIAATEMSRITLGTFLPVQNPGDIVSFLQGVTFANIEDVVFTNLTTREVSTDVRLSPDGSFHGFVPVREGRNRVRITALASDGSKGSVELDLDFEKSGLSARELALELERIRERNKELLLLIERERIQRFREQQRKVLEIEPEAAGEGEEE